jgi:excisionase family DNA binding protein
MKTTEERLLRIDEIAQMLGCSQSHIRRLRESGKLPAINIGLAGRPCLRWRCSTFQQYLKGQESV